jgi:hypothetical protein
MSEADPMRKQYDMGAFRLALREMWKGMRTLYLDGSLFFRTPDGVLLFRKVPFPEIADFEIKAEKRRGEDRL